MLSAVVVSVFTALTFQQATTAVDATASDPAAQPATAAPAPPDPLDRRVCREETLVGSRFSSRVCLTQREWNRRRDESRAQAQRIGTQQDNNGGRIVAPGH